MTTTATVGDRTRTITTADDAAFLILVPPPSTAGGGNGWFGQQTWTIQFAPSFDFDGVIVVMGRAPGRPSTMNPPAFVPISYTADFLNGVANNQVTLLWTPITSASNIAIPAFGKQVAILCSVSAGSMTIYTNGPAQS